MKTTKANNNGTKNAKNISELNLARAAKKCAANTFCGIAKSLYGYSETEEGAFLRGFLPKDKKAFLQRGADVCAFGHVGETKTTKSCSYVIKISADIVLRFINNERKNATK